MAATRISADRATAGRSRVREWLTFDRQAIADRLYDMQANHYDNSTNIGGGLERAISELTSARARDNARELSCWAVSAAGCPARNGARAT